MATLAADLLPSYAVFLVRLFYVLFQYYEKPGEC